MRPLICNTFPTYYKLTVPRPLHGSVSTTVKCQGEQFQLYKKFINPGENILCRGDVYLLEMTHMDEHGH